MEICIICKNVIEGVAMGCSYGTFCESCAKDTNLAGNQPIMSVSQCFYALAETFFRKGKGEEVTFEKVWQEHNSLKLIKFEDLLIIDKLKEE